ncbi:hypothetical protein V6259_12465 [Marinomonas sp. TI.3.20]|uniref:hypothetical protein n=1 Tax=Marinomonas sp. TI.3.20 TaxID=3121296 RepID=UPI00311DA260
MFHEIELPHSFSLLANKMSSAYRKKIRGFTKSHSRFTSLINEVGAGDSATGHAFLCDDFSYVTYYLVDGLAIAPTSQTFGNIITSFNTSLSAELKDGHYIEDCFATYQDNIQDRIGVYLDGRQETAEKLGLNVKAKDESMKRMLEHQMFFETHIIALVTPNDKNLYINDDGLLKENIPDIPLSEHYMDAYRQGAGDRLLTKHNLFVSVFERFVTDVKCNISATRLNHQKAKSILKVFTSTKSADVLLENMPPVNLTPTGLSGDTGDQALDEALGKDYHQALFGDGAEVHPKDRNIIVHGDRVFLSVLVDSYSKGPSSYNELHAEILKKRIPYISKTRIGGNPLALLKKEFVASKATWTLQGNETQQKFKIAYQKIRDFYKNNTVVNISQSFLTWVDGTDEAAIKKLYNRANDLVMIIEKWTTAENNKCHIDRRTPLHSFYSSMPCVLRSTAAKIPHALVDVVARCPYMRPSLPYTNTGDMLLMADDGKALPFDPLVGRTAKIAFLVGAMGSGKTVIAQALRDRMVLKRGNKNIPYQFSIDVGASTEASTVAYAVENPAIKDKFAFIRMDQAYINILETPLGLRQLPKQLFSTINSLIADRLMGVHGDEMPQASDMLGECLNFAYEKCAHPSTAKQIRLAEIPWLEEQLSYLGFEFKEAETSDVYKNTVKYLGWDIVDFLCLHSLWDRAYEVQRLCVPTMKDVLAAAARTEWLEKYRLTVDGIILSEVFPLKLQSFIDSYPSVCKPSSVTIWNKHVCTFELGEVVTQGGNAEDEYKSRFWFGLVFIFIRNTLSLQNAFIKTYHDQIDREQQWRSTQTYQSKSAEGIKKYHLDKITELVNSPKRSYIDEVHRFLPVDLSQAGYAQTILSSFINEVRRSGTELAFASPQPAHGKFFNKVATLVMILGFQSDAMADDCIEAFGLSQEEVDRYVKPLRLDHGKGANFYMLLRDIGKISKISEFRQTGYFPVPMVEIWSYANEFIEVYIRNQLYRKLGANRALEVLAMALPKAGASEMILTAQAQIKKSVAKKEKQPTKDDEDKVDAAAGDKVLQEILENLEYWTAMAQEKIYGIKAS